MFGSFALPREARRRRKRHRGTEDGRGGREEGAMEANAEVRSAAAGSPSVVGVLTLAPHVNAYESDIEQTLITQQDIQAKLAELGERISDDYRGRDLGRASCRERV